ncbi:MAG: ABC transporter substrate-binding protein [Planctomycetota bacterium]|jgi:tungstate transport system substrate-binding protein
MRWLGLIVLLAACSGAPDPSARVRLATTTSTENSGLLAHLLPPFEKASGIDVQVIAVGTGQALALGRRGDVDVVLVHARSREDKFVAEGHGVDRRDVMWNDFVILGPPDDPAGVKGLRDAAHAFSKIRAGRAKFVSRGDDSGTHIRELALWEKSGGRPASRDLYLEAGQGMGKCLIMADEVRGYILADRGTYLAFRGRVELAVLVEGDPALRNPYGVILVNPERHVHVEADAARKLLGYLTSPEGQQRIAEFRVKGQVLFHPASQG